MDIPKEIMKSMHLKPFMAGKMQAEKEGIKLFGFEKTVKIKIDIDEKTLAVAKKIMRLEGHGSLDETILNVVHEFFEKEKKSKTNRIHRKGTKLSINLEYALKEFFK